jgi:hypothetical protein
MDPNVFNLVRPVAFVRAEDESADQLSGADFGQHACVRGVWVKLNPDFGQGFH